MLVVKIEIWPFGQESKKRELGRMSIANDGTGGVQTGNYNAKIFKSMEYSEKALSTSVWKKGRVEDFPRLRLGPWDLLLRSLFVCIGKRNKEVG